MKEATNDVYEGINNFEKTLKNFTFEETVQSRFKSISSTNSVTSSYTNGNSNGANGNGLNGSRARSPSALKRTTPVPPTEDSQKYVDKIKVLSYYFLAFG
jgi:hypothetical protein